MKSKSCGSVAMSSSIKTSSLTMSLPRFLFVKVQVTVSLRETSMFVGGEPSLQVTGI